MSTKTFFKRIALAVTVSMGFGFLSAPSSQAALLTTSVTLTSATASAVVGDTATNTIVVRASGNGYDGTNDASKANTDSVTLRYTCDAPTGASCPTLAVKQNQLSDTANVMAKAPALMDSWRNLSSGVTDSLTSTTATGRSTYSVSTNGVNGSTAVGEAFAAAGTYTYNFYLTGSGPNNVLTLSSGGTLVTWTVTVTAPSTNVTGGSATVYISSDTHTAQANRSDWLNGPRSSDSTIVVSKGSAATPAPVGYAYLNLFSAAGDTRVAVGNGFNPVQDSVTVTVSGPGLVYAGSIATQGKTLGKSTTMSISNGRTDAYDYPTETLVIYNDGTAGTMTLTFSKGSTTLATKTVTFFGDPASVVANLSDTYTSLAGTVTLSGQVKDSGGNVLSAGTVYVFSSDTKIAGSVPTTAVFGQTGHRCTTFTGTSAATWRLSCGITLTDTGVVTLTVGDSWTVAGSSWTSTAVELTITGNTVGSATVSFDKATYAPGERGIITITTKDVAGRLSANGASGALAAAYSNYTLTGSTTLPFRGTSSSDNTYGTTLSRYQDTGVETRVVVMPTINADLTYTIEVPGFGTGALNTLVTATAKVVDPNSVAIAGSTAAAEAATDAAAEAIDAANAATDAANLAAEAADAATVAAEEARDAADAATAAVEELATQVATLMAALKAQITTLANTVAKIAKKVKA
jgi:hypothetical protein